MFSYLPHISWAISSTLDKIYFMQDTQKYTGVNGLTLQQTE